MNDKEAENKSNEQFRIMGRLKAQELSMEEMERVSGGIHIWVTGTSRSDGTFDDDSGGK